MFLKSDSSLKDFLNYNAKFAFEYGDRLTNHLPMTVIAYKQLNAKTEIINNFIQHYTPRLTTLNHSQQHLLDARIESYLSRFSENGVGAVLKEKLEELSANFGSAAFHALIRLSYAVQADSHLEIALALIYWENQYTPLPKFEISDLYSAEEQLNFAAKLFNDHHFQPGIIDDRINEVVRHSNFHLISLSPSSLTLEEVAELILQQFYHTNDFTLLHGVTGFHAFNHLLPYMNDKEIALRQFWQAYIAAFSTTQKPFQPSVPNKNKTESQQLDSWEAMISRAFF